MAKRNRDKGLLYDINQIQDHNAQFLKKPELYSHYIWTGKLHPIRKVAKPFRQPQFAIISKQLQKHRQYKKTDFHPDQLTTFPFNFQAEERKKHLIDTWNTLYQNKIATAIKRNTSQKILQQKKRFPLQTKYLEFHQQIFNPKPCLSDYTLQKHHDFKSAIEDLHREINPPYEPTSARKYTVKTRNTSQSRLLPRNRKLLTKLAY